MQYDKLLDGIITESKTFFDNLFESIRETKIDEENIEETIVGSSSSSTNTGLDSNKIDNSTKSKWVAINVNKARTRESVITRSSGNLDIVQSTAEKKRRSLSLSSAEKANKKPETVVHVEEPPKNTEVKKIEKAEIEVTESPSVKAKKYRVARALLKLKRDSSSANIIETMLSKSDGKDKETEKPREMPKKTDILESAAILPVLKELEKGDEICFDYNPIEPDMPLVRYGTIEKLVERLTLPVLAQGKYPFLLSNYYFEM